MCISIYIYIYIDIYIYIYIYIEIIHCNIEINIILTSGIAQGGGGSFRIGHLFGRGEWNITIS